MIDWNEPSTLKTGLAILEIIGLFTGFFTVAGLIVIALAVSGYTLLRGALRLTIRAVRFLARPRPTVDEVDLSTPHYVVVRLSRYVPRVWYTRQD